MYETMHILVHKKNTKMKSYVIPDFRSKRKDEFSKTHSPTWLSRVGQVSHLVSTFVYYIQKKEHTVTAAAGTVDKRLNAFCLCKRLLLSLQWSTVKQLCWFQNIIFQNIFLYPNISHSISRFDVEKECERIDGDVVENDPPVIYNTGHPNIKTKVDASCNVLCRASHIYFLATAKHCEYLICVGMCLKCVVSTTHPVLSQQEKLLLANRERDKGNEAFRVKDYEEAVVYYSRSGS